MISALLALALAGAAGALGPSPLAAPDHRHAWADLAVDDKGEGWVDQAWRASTTLDGRPVQLVLVRMQLTDSAGDPLVFDAVMAVDCPAGQIGVKETWLFQSRYGNQMRAPIRTLTLDYASTPPSPGDRAIIAHACGDAKAAS